MRLGPSRSTIAVAVAAGALLLAGCTESVEDASGDYCSNLDSLQAELAALESLLAGDATLDEINEQREVVRDAFDATAASAGDLNEAVSGEADSANDSYPDAYAGVPGHATHSEAGPQYASAVQGYPPSLATIADDAGCDSGS